MPSSPWSMNSIDVAAVEDNMRSRRIAIQQQMQQGCAFLTITSLPCLGANENQWTGFRPQGPSIDKLVSPASREQALITNERSRRGRNVQIDAPVYLDKYTRRPFRRPSIDPNQYDQLASESEECGITLDATLSGICCCGLQVTMQLRDVTEARKLYDQLIPLGPIMLALTAATPIMEGFLAGTDVRWNANSACHDDRTLQETGEVPLRDGRQSTLRARVSSNSTFISQDSRLLPHYFDPNLVIDHDVKKKLLDSGMDELLANHFAHLFIRDPLVVYNKDLEPDAREDTPLFETVQGTNWGSVRFKPPPSLHSADIGWRVEFRPMEIQLTDFENAAFAIFIVLLSQTILHFNLNLYMPIPLIDKNMEKAHANDAVLLERFHFRTDPCSASYIAPCATTTNAKSVAADHDSSNSGPQFHFTRSPHPDGEKSEVSSSSAANANTTPPSSYCSSDQSGTSSTYEAEKTKMPGPGSDTARDSPARWPSLARPSGLPSPPYQDDHAPSNEFSLQTISTLMNGNPSSGFPGFIPLIKQYLDQCNTFDVKARAKVDEYLALIANRAGGRAWTAAKWQRHYVRSHPDYKSDSIVSEKMMYDLFKTINKMENPSMAKEVAEEMFNT